MEVGTGCPVLTWFLSEPVLPLVQGIGSHLLDIFTIYAEDTSQQNLSLGAWMQAESSSTALLKLHWETCISS